MHKGSWFSDTKSHTFPKNNKQNSSMMKTIGPRYFHKSDILSMGLSNVDLPPKNQPPRQECLRGSRALWSPRRATGKIVRWPESSARLHWQMGCSHASGDPVCHPPHRTGPTGGSRTLHSTGQLPNLTLKTSR